MSRPHRLPVRQCTVTGNVNINLSNSSICEIDGDCGSGRANVSVVTEHQYSSAMKNIGLLYGGQRNA